MIKKNKFDLSFLKKNSSLKDAFIKSISINKNYHLIPVSEFDENDKKLISNLCRLRNNFGKYFPNNSKTNIFKTKKWLKNNVIKSTNRILFILYNNNYDFLGHIGLANKSSKSIEIDNVIKDLDNKKNIDFSKVIKKLIQWIQNTLFITSIYVRVNEKNKRAIKFYKKNNFKLSQKKNLMNKNISDHIIMEYENNFKIPKKTILTAGPSISQKEIYYTSIASENGWNENHSDYIKKLENKFKDYLNVKYALATSSCTGAMHLALKALGISSGDEVLVPEITWVATAKAVQYVGAIPKFVEVNKNDWNIDILGAKKKITKRTKAIMPVHTYGNPCDMTEIVKLSRKNNLKIIEDAAPAIGAKWKNNFCGTFGDFGAFSFQGAKLVVSGEGGMLVTNNSRLYDLAFKLSNNGRDPKKTFWINSDGYKYKMSNIQAALALGQMERVDDLIFKKRQIHHWYKKYLNSKFVDLIIEKKNSESIYWMSSIYIKKNNLRNNLISFLLKNRIDSRPVFPAISQYPIWLKKHKTSPIAKNIGNNSINLPSGVTLNENQIKYIADTINRFFFAN